MMHPLTACLARDGPASVDNAILEDLSALPASVSITQLILPRTFWPQKACIPAICILWVWEAQHCNSFISQAEVRQLADDQMWKTRFYDAAGTIACSLELCFGSCQRDMQENAPDANHVDPCSHLRRTLAARAS